MLRVIAALGAVVVLAFPHAPASAEVTGRIAGISHHHPRDRSFSWLAARIKTSPGARVEVLARDGEVLSKSRVSCRASGRGRAIAVWKVDDPALYTIEAKITKDGESITKTGMYRVPFPPEPPWGPFRFKLDDGCHRGWPHP